MSITRINHKKKNKTNHCVENNHKPHYKKKEKKKKDPDSYMTR